MNVIMPGTLGTRTDTRTVWAVRSPLKGVPVPDIAKNPTSKVGKNAGESPLVASLYRALAEAEATAADDSLPLRPTPVRSHRPEDPLTPEVIDLRDRLQAQPPPERRAAVVPPTTCLDSMITGHRWNVDVVRCSRGEPYTGLDADLVVEVLSGSGRHGTLTVVRIR
ncbi:hypothetical protein ACN6K8_004817 [[Kitasatospora] papulosa]|uniref:hypothetical protein n=1 Tax=[Kitasatospora] papulosa TaxID=1464011 RepID=UPI00403C2B76